MGWQDLALAGAWLGVLNIFCLAYVPQCHRLRADEREHGVLSTLLRAKVSHASAARITRINHRMTLALAVLTVARTLQLTKTTLQVAAAETIEWERLVPKL